MRRSAARIALWSALGSALTVTAYLLVNTTFMPYDDEGYVLISLRNYLAGLRLYDDVFSQYGPWPFVYHELITTGLQADMTHTLGRALTVFHWVAAALLCGLVAWRLTRSHLAAFVTVVTAFGLSWQNTSEPSHPGSHVALLVALGAAIVSFLPDARRVAAAYAALGVITALLLLTKINVGLLFAAGLGCVVLRYTAWPDRWQRATVGLAVTGLLAIPWVLLGRQLSLSWVMIFAVLFTLAATGLLWVTPPARAGTKLPALAWLAAPLACLVAGSLVCLRVWQHGTSLESILHAVLISPLRMPAKFMVGITWYPEVWVLVVTGTIAIFKAGWEIRVHGHPARSTIWAILGLRVAVLAGFVLYAREWPTYFGIFHFGAYCLPLVPVFVVPLGKEADSRRFARWGVALIAVPQVLHAFPVAGSQLAWATFLCVPVLIAGLAEFREVLPSLVPRASRRLLRFGTVALVGTAAYQLGLLGHTGWSRYTHSRPIDLAGAGDIRLDGATRHALRLLSLNAGIHADLLFSRQGMFSHNLWSGVPTPTAQNATQWFWLLNHQHQGEIVARLEATPRTALINSHSIDQFMIDHKIPVGGPLQDFVTRHYRPLFRYGDFTFHVPHGSRAVPFGRYELLEPETTTGTVLFRSHVALDGQIGQIRLERIEFPWDPGPELLTNHSQAFAEPIDREGRSTGATIPLPSVRPLRGLYRLSVISPRLPEKLPWQEYAVAVRDPNGNLLSESVH